MRVLTALWSRPALVRNVEPGMVEHTMSARKADRSRRSMRYVCREDVEINNPEGAKRAHETKDALLVQEEKWRNADETWGHCIGTPYATGLLALSSDPPVGINNDVVMQRTLHPPPQSEDQ